MFLLEDIKYGSPVKPVLSKMSSFPRKAGMKHTEEKHGRKLLWP